MNCTLGLILITVACGLFSLALISDIYWYYEGKKIKGKHNPFAWFIAVVCLVYFFYSIIHHLLEFFSIWND